MLIAAWLGSVEPKPCCELLPPAGRVKAQAVDLDARRLAMQIRNVRTRAAILVNTPLEPHTKEDGALAF
jgi:hypothetical protein